MVLATLWQSSTRQPAKVPAARYVAHAIREVTSAPSEILRVDARSFRYATLNARRTSSGSNNTVTLQGYLGYLPPTPTLRTLPSHSVQ